MTKERIKEIAGSINNGDVVRMTYVRPVDYSKKRWTGKSIRKVSVFELPYDERDYFRMMRETNGLNVNPSVDQGYEKVGGCLYKKENSEELYIRLFSPSSRFKPVSVKYYTNGREVTFEEIKDFLNKSELNPPDYQDKIANMGHEIADKIKSSNYLVKRVLNFSKVR